MGAFELLTSCPPAPRPRSQPVCCTPPYRWESRAVPKCRRPAGCRWRGNLFRPLPRFGIHVGVIDRYGELQIVAVHAMKALFDPQVLAVRAAGMIDPAARIHTDCINHESVIVHPLPDGIAVPSRLGIFRKLAPVSPDDPVISIKLIQDDDLVGRLNEFNGSQFVKLHPREAERIALVARIVGQRRRNLPDARSGGLIGFERFQCAHRQVQCSGRHGCRSRRAARLRCLVRAASVAPGVPARRFLGCRPPSRPRHPTLRKWSRRGAGADFFPA